MEAESLKKINCLEVRSHMTISYKYKLIVISDIVEEKSSSDFSANKAEIGLQ